MDTQSLIVLVVFAMAIAGAIVLSRSSPEDRPKWLDALFGWMIDPFTGRRDWSDLDAPRTRRGRDMAFSAGRDPAHRNTRLRQVFIPMEPEHQSILRDFYLNELGLDEMRAPNSHLQQDGFWAVAGTRQLYLGTMPDFKSERGVLPAFPVRNIRDISERLTELGFETLWDRSNPFMEQLILIDPAGNKIALKPA